MALSQPFFQFGLGKNVPYVMPPKVLAIWAESSFGHGLGNVFFCLADDGPIPAGGLTHM